MSKLKSGIAAAVTTTALLTGGVFGGTATEECAGTGDVRCWERKVRENERERDWQASIEFCKFAAVVSGGRGLNTQFDMYVTADGIMHMSGTPREIYEFKKCLRQRGHTLEAGSK